MLMIASLLAGLVFGAGLLISGMVNPTKVLAFLDIFGAWDPGFMLANGRSRPLLAAQSVWPTKKQIDRPLFVGAALFGVGWGLVGLCPGPALESLATLSPGVIAFVAAMAVGMILQNIWQRSGAIASREKALAIGADG